jgi:hypothetical protein
MSLVYQHIRQDTGEIFYIGIGESERRAHDMKGRNDIWHSIARKTKIIVEIIKKDITREEARSMERKLISEYGRRDKMTGVLANKSIGGEGDCIGRSKPMEGYEDRQRIINRIEKMMPDKYKFMGPIQYMAMLMRKREENIKNY